MPKLCNPCRVGVEVPPATQGGATRLRRCAYPGLLYQALSSHRATGVPHSEHTPVTFPVKSYPQFRHKPRFRLRHLRNGPRMKAMVG